jgi:hypothetical protein
MASIATVRTNTDALTTQAIVHRDSIAKNYVPIIHPVIYLPMLQLRKDGDCEIVDPRACLNHYNSAADLACIIYSSIGLNFFHAMVKAGYVAHGLRVVRHCTENDEFQDCIVVNKQDGLGPRDESVEEMLLKYKTKEGSCRPGVELINMENGYLFNPITVRKRGRNGSESAMPASIMSRQQWFRKVREDKKLYDCRRRLATDEAARHLSGATCRKDAQSSSDGRVVVPVLVIKAAWCFPGYENRKKNNLNSYRV